MKTKTTQNEGQSMARRGDFDSRNFRVVTDAAA